MLNEKFNLNVLQIIKLVSVSVPNFSFFEFFYSKNTVFVIKEKTVFLFLFLLAIEIQLTIVEGEKKKTSLKK